MAEPVRLVVPAAQIEAPSAPGGGTGGGGGTQQQRVLQAINDSVGSTVPTGVVYGILGGMGVLIGVAYLSRKWLGAVTEPTSTKKETVRHPKKLLKEMAAELDLSKAEMAKLKHHSERLGVENPLTLMLCPSLLKAKSEGATDRGEGTGVRGQG